MPIQIASYLLPKNNGTFFLLDDEFIRGGFKVVADTTARNAMESVRLKEGALVFVVSENKYYKYIEATTSWTEIPLGVAGPQGPAGPAGADGTFSGTYNGSGSITGTFSVNNTYASLAALPSAIGKIGTVAVAADTGKVYVSNGTSWIELLRSGSIPYDIALNVYGKPNVNGDLLSTFAPVRAVSIASGASGVARCAVAPGAALTLSIKKNGTQVGTASFSAGATVGAVSFPSSVSLTSGDVVELFNPAAADSAIEDISVTVLGMV